MSGRYPCVLEVNPRDCRSCWLVCKTVDSGWYPWFLGLVKRIIDLLVISRPNHSKFIRASIEHFAVSCSWFKDGSSCHDSTTISLTRLQFARDFQESVEWRWCWNLLSGWSGLLLVASATILLFFPIGRFREWRGLWRQYQISYRQKGVAQFWTRRSYKCLQVLTMTGWVFKFKSAVLFPFEVFVATVSKRYNSNLAG